MSILLHLSLAGTGLAFSLFSAGVWLALSARLPRSDRTTAAPEIRVTLIAEPPSQRRERITA